MWVRVLKRVYTLCQTSMPTFPFLHPHFKTVLIGSASRRHLSFSNETNHGKRKYPKMRSAKTSLQDIVLLPRIENLSAECLNRRQFAVWYCEHVFNWAWRFTLLWIKPFILQDFFFFNELAEYRWPSQPFWICSHLRIKGIETNEKYYFIFYCIMPGENKKALHK